MNLKLYGYETVQKFGACSACGFVNARCSRIYGCPDPRQFLIVFSSTLIRQLIYTGKKRQLIRASQEQLIFITDKGRFFFQPGEKRLIFLTGTLVIRLEPGPLGKFLPDTQQLLVQSGTQQLRLICGQVLLEYRNFFLTGPSRHFRHSQPRRPACQGKCLSIRQRSGEIYRLCFPDPPQYQRDQRRTHHCDIPDEGAAESCQGIIVTAPWRRNAR